MSPLLVFVAKLPQRPFLIYCWKTAPLWFGVNQCCNCLCEIAASLIAKCVCGM